MSFELKILTDILVIQKICQKSSSEFLLGMFKEETTSHILL